MWGSCCICNSFFRVFCPRRNARVVNGLDLKSNGFGLAGSNPVSVDLFLLFHRTPPIVRLGWRVLSDSWSTKSTSPPCRAYARHTSEALHIY